VVRHFFLTTNPQSPLMTKARKAYSFVRDGHAFYHTLKGCNAFKAIAKESLYDPDECTLEEVAGYGIGENEQPLEHCESCIKRERHLEAERKRRHQQRVKAKAKQSQEEEEAVPPPAVRSRVGGKTLVVGRKQGRPASLGRPPAASTTSSSSSSSATPPPRRTIVDDDGDDDDDEHHSNAVDAPPAVTSSRKNGGKSPMAMPSPKPPKQRGPVDRKGAKPLPRSAPAPVPADVPAPAPAPATRFADLPERLVTLSAMRAAGLRVTQADPVLVEELMKHPHRIARVKKLQDRMFKEVDKRSSKKHQVPASKLVKTSNALIWKTFGIPKVNKTKPSSSKKRQRSPSRWGGDGSTSSSPEDSSTSGSDPSDSDDDSDSDGSDSDTSGSNPSDSSDDSGDSDE